MSEDFEVENVIRIHTSDATLEVVSDPDTGCFVEIRTPDKRSSDWYGKVRLCMPPELAKALAKAILQVAEHIQTAESSK